MCPCFYVLGVQRPINIYSTISTNGKITLNYGYGLLVIRFGASNIASAYILERSTITKLGGDSSNQISVTKESEYVTKISVSTSSTYSATLIGVT